MAQYVHPKYRPPEFKFKMPNTRNPYDTSGRSFPEPMPEYFRSYEEERRRRQVEILKELYDGPMFSQAFAYKIEKTGNDILFKGHYLDVIDRIKEPKLARKNNINQFQKSVLDGDPEFYGGEFSDVFQRPDIEPFQEAKKRLAKSNFHRKIVPIIAKNNRRRREKNEYDGDFDFDARWDVQPFNSARRKPVNQNRIEMIVDFSINCMCSPEEINRYGAFIWAVTQLLESAGISLSVDIRCRSEGISDKSNCEIMTRIKNSNEYVSPVVMASCFRAVFYRKAIFGLWISLVDEHGEDVLSGLGRGGQFEKTAEYKDGVLKLAIGADFDTPQVEKALLEIITQKEGV